jgi:gluconate 5-dehydrogenase
MIPAMKTPDMFDLSGKIALVTGGSRGLGLQMAHGLGEMNARVAISARSEDDLAQAAASLQAAGIDATAIRHDLGDVQGADALVERVVERVGDVDILINNAAIASEGAAEDVAPEDWNRVMDININALFFLTQAVGRRCMIPRRHGKVLNISSTGGLGGVSRDTFLASYSASKAAVIGLTRALAAEWGRYDINVNAIAPGYFPSPMTRATLPPGHVARVLSKTPLERFGGDDDLKGIAVFFVSEAARHLTGQYVVADGGAFNTVYPTVPKAA